MHNILVTRPYKYYGLNSMLATSKSGSLKPCTHLIEACNPLATVAIIIPTIAHYIAS